jgi:sulfate/thiosulfate transport system substrate-binding protein
MIDQGTGLAGKTRKLITVLALGAAAALGLVAQTAAADTTLLNVS